MTLMDTEVTFVPCGTFGTELQPIAVYVNLLREYGLRSREAATFKKAHLKDRVFARRAKGAERLFQYKDEILRELDRLEG